MGFFKKTRLALSGLNGQIEANILNAFELLESRISRKKLLKFHKKTPIPLYSFAYNIAADAWLSVYPDPNQNNLKVLKLVIRILNDMGYETVVDVNDPEIVDKDLNLGMYGHRYMTNVLVQNKPLYLEAIKDAASQIKREARKSFSWWW
jgi:hypothetical protein